MAFYGIAVNFIIQKLKSKHFSLVTGFLRGREKIFYTYSRPISAFTKTILMKKAMQFLAALGLFVQISSAYHQHSWFEIPNAFETPRDRFTFQKVHSKLLLVDKNTNKCQLGCKVFSEKYLSILGSRKMLKKQDA